MTLVLALLLCAPERVTLVARKAERPSALSRIEAGLGAAWKRLYQREDDQAGEANALAAQGDAEGALKLYDAAQARLPDNPALAFDRSGVLLKVPDPSAVPQAASEAARALEKGDPPLKAQAAYQLALATEAMGHPDEAMKLYAGALALDPDDVDSKVNLELLLRTQEDRKKRQAGQPQQSQQKKDQPQQSPDKSKGQDPQGKDKQAGNQQQKQQNDAQPQPGAEQQARQQEEKPRQPEEKPVDRSDAERLLDALRASEKNLQVWRFAKEKSKEARRGEAEKDW